MEFLLGGTALFSRRSGAHCIFIHVVLNLTILAQFVTDL